MFLILLKGNLGNKKLKNNMKNDKLNKNLSFTVIGKYVNKISNKGITILKILKKDCNNVRYMSLLIDVE